MKRERKISFVDASVVAVPDQYAPHTHTVNLLFNSRFVARVLHFCF